MNENMKPKGMDCVDWMTFETRHRWKESKDWYPPGYRGWVRGRGSYSETGDQRSFGVGELRYESMMDWTTRNGFTDYEVWERDAKEENEAWFADRANQNLMEIDWQIKRSMIAWENRNRLTALFNDPSSTATP